jgi:ubiquinone/menaquinone biosynthesis C-methylase UbiE
MSSLQIEKSAKNYYLHQDFNPKRWEQQFDGDSFYKKIIVGEFIPKVNCHSLRMLEVGMGTGVEMSLVMKQRPDLQYVGVDFAPSFIDIALTKTYRLKQCRPASFVQANALNLPFRKNSFDLSLALALLHHLEYDHAEGFLNNLNAVLSHDSLSLISVRQGKGTEYNSEKRITYSRYTHEEIIKLLSRTNFHPIQDPFELKSQAKTYNRASYLTYIIRKTNSS